MTDSLTAKTCKPCEGGVPTLTPAEVAALLPDVPGWAASADGKWISRTYKYKDFAAALRLLNAAAQVAEHEGHHPDLHLEGYRRLRIELTTHAIGGLSENDFILAAKIDQLPEAAV